MINETEKFKKVKIIFMDVDGVLTDGSVIFIDGQSPRTWYVRDRAAIKLLKSNLPALKIVWITARHTEELALRAKELDVDNVFTDIKIKIKVMDEVLRENNLSYKDAMYIGDDIIDRQCMLKAGLSCCPKDAVDEIKEIATFVSSYPGGRGAVREIIEKTLKSKGIWQNIIAQLSS